MRKVYWRLKYADGVVSKLYSLRESGHELHNAIKELQYQREPWVKALQIKERVGRFEFEVQSCWIGFEISDNPEDKEATLIIVYLQELMDR